MQVYLFMKFDIIRMLHIFWPTDKKDDHCSTVDKFCLSSKSYRGATELHYNCWQQKDRKMQYIFCYNFYFRIFYITRLMNTYEIAKNKLLRFKQEERLWYLDIIAYSIDKMIVIKWFKELVVTECFSFLLFIKNFWINTCKIIV